MSSKRAPSSRRKIEAWALACECGNTESIAGLLSRLRARERSCLAALPSASRIDRPTDEATSKVRKCVAWRTTQSQRPFDPTTTRNVSTRVLFLDLSAYSEPIDPTRELALSQAPTDPQKHGLNLFQVLPDCPVSSSTHGPWASSWSLLRTAGLSPNKLEIKTIETLSY